MIKTTKKITIYETDKYVYGEYCEDDVIQAHFVEPLTVTEHAFTEIAEEMFDSLYYKAYDAEKQEGVHPAKVGDTIELTEPFYTSECEYDEGARFQVVYAHSNGDVCIFDDGLVAIPFTYFKVVNEEAATAPKAKQKLVRDTNFKVGDKVRFRSWEDMEKQYGLTENGEIACELLFVDDMRPLCGKTATIRSISNKMVDLTNDSDFEDFCLYDYSTDMIEKV